MGNGNSIAHPSDQILHVFFTLFVGHGIGCLDDRRQTDETISCSYCRLFENPSRKKILHQPTLQFADLVALVGREPA